MKRLAITIEGHTFEVSVNWDGQMDLAPDVNVGDRPVDVLIPAIPEDGNGLEWVVVDGRPYEVSFDQDLRSISTYASIHSLEIQDLDVKVKRPPSGDSRVKAPIPGLIARILVEEGSQVKTGDPVIVLEAMKMENEIHALTSGKVQAIHVTPHQTVQGQQVLLEIEPISDES